jgi:hypothetical protein
MKTSVSTATNQPASVVSQKQTASNCTCPTTKPGICARTLKKALSRPVIFSPSPGENLPSQDPNKAALLINQQPGKRMVVSAIKQGEKQCSPAPEVATLLPKQMPAVSMVPKRPASVDSTRLKMNNGAH